MYDKFALAYDEMMEELDYVGWVDYLEKLMKMGKRTPKEILDLACGTANHAIWLAKRGYKVTGVDASLNMLAVADAKAREMGVHISLFHQDMRNIDLDILFDVVLSSCDSINYITEYDHLISTFKGVYEVLENEGLFIFDINSIYKLKEVLGNNTFAENFDNSSYIWENYWDEESKILNMYLTLFIKENCNYYSKFDEFHMERAYEVEEIEEALKRCGFEVAAIFESFTVKSYSPSSERIHFVSKKA